MNKPYIVQKREFIEYFNKVSPRQKRKLISTLPKGEINCISEICKKILNRKLTENSNIIRKLRPAEKEIKAISLKSVPIYRKKKILQTKKGGAILSLLLPLAASIVTSLIAR